MSAACPARCNPASTPSCAARSPTCSRAATPTPSSSRPDPERTTMASPLVRQRRRFPRPRDFLPLLKFKKPVLNPTRRRLERALTIWDLRAIAKRRTPKAAFDYTDGAADAELSLARARQAFEDITFHPAILRDVSVVDTSVEVLGVRSALPFGIAPTGFTRMMQSEGEI